MPRCLFAFWLALPCWALGQQPGPSSWLWEVKPLRTVDSSLGQVLGDIESHMPAGHPYRSSDKITWAHETTHGLNSYLRNALQKQGQARVQCLYVLNDRCVVLTEPRGVTLAQVASAVPAEQRGRVYQLYLVQQQRDWNDTPTYVLDEWVAYSNGAAVGKELGLDYGSELEFAQEFTNYAKVLASLVDDRAIREFVACHERVVAGLQGPLVPPMRLGGREFVEPWNRARENHQ